ncbi:fluoride efflux transporter FluC [Sphaerisporangium perillae]|uniref:fluoride efflux transporter FluC n=1 Tax=Sphaerisporangium perillae TaxID=2935860 RepID=UPI00200C1B68|nr:CrcB family protein [Sphaerisporangium perillae]
MILLLVAAGAAVGAPLRYLTDRAVQSRYETTFPWGTLIVNVAGSALLGFLAALPAGEGMMALLGSGFCGALSTYSTFGYETLRLIQTGARLVAVLNVVAGIAAGLAAAGCGALLAHLVAG